MVNGAALGLAVMAATASGAAAEPIPYEQLRGPVEGRDWCGQASAWLLAGGADCAAAPPAVRLNNYWRLRQDPRRPWRGTPKADGFNGAAREGLAVFADPRWSARAIAIELRDAHAAGARSAAAYGARLGWREEEARALAGALDVSVAADLRLFEADGRVGPGLRPALRALARAAAGREPSEGLLRTAEEAVAYDRLDQSEAGFARWEGASAARRQDVAAFEAFLAGQGLSGVFPTWQILRTGSDWKGCGAPFAVPPRPYWDNIASALRVIGGEIKPAVSGLEARSGWRDPWLNVCAGGAGKSAHLEFWALDMTPGGGIDRTGLMARLCPIYAARGRELNLGLGFYSDVRFHIDAMSRRSWASYNGQAYWPCADDGSVNPPPDVPPPPEPFPPPPPSR